MIDSALVSAQRRKRLYWTNIPNVTQPEDKSLFLKDVFIYDESLVRHDQRIEKTAVRKKNYIQYAVNEKHLTSQAFRLYRLTDKSPTIARCRTESKCNISFNPENICEYKVISPIEAERLQTLPDNYTEGVPKTRRFEAIGNGWTVDVIVHILKPLREEKQMELRVNEITIPEGIEFNYEELKKELTKKVQFYETLVYTEDQLKEAKTDRASLNKLKKALNDERIRREKEYLKPFAEFKEKITELIGIIDKPIQMIDEQVKDFEEKRKQEKRYEIGQVWQETEHPEWLVLTKIFDDRWLNTSYSMKQVKEDIDEILARISEDTKTIEELPEYSIEAADIYKRTLSLSVAISEGKRLAELYKQKEEKKAQEAREKAQKTGEELAKGYGEGLRDKADEVAVWINFTARLTVPQAEELRDFFNARHIEFKPL